MNPLQKAIKYLAIAFAIFLIVTIIGGIMTGIAGISLLFSDSDGSTGEMQMYSIDGDISSLSIDLSGAKLQIKASDTLSVESNNNYISVKTEEGRLSIKETRKLFTVYPKGITVILNIPEDYVFDKASVETGAGRVKIDALCADILKLSLGAGEADIKNLTARERAEIDAGAGKLKVNGGLLNNLELDMGVGDLTLKSRIEGKSSLDYGIGDTELILLGDNDDYKIEIDKGIGAASVAGENAHDDYIYGNGKNRIEIDGGIGSMKIDFSED